MIRLDGKKKKQLSILAAVQPRKKKKNEKKKNEQKTKLHSANPVIQGVVYLPYFSHLSVILLHSNYSIAHIILQTHQCKQIRDSNFYAKPGELHHRYGTAD